MNRILFVILSVIAASFIVSCSGNYNANPSSNANYSSNPLNPPAYNWVSSGKDPMSATINGSAWVASTTGTTYSFSASSGNVIMGTNNGTFVVVLNVKTAYTGNTYPMGYMNYNTWGVVYDSFGNPNAVYNYVSLWGISGGVDIIENDSARIKGLFYFEGVNSSGTILNVTDGYFNIPKM